MQAPAERNWSGMDCPKGLEGYVEEWVRATHNAGLQTLKIPKYGSQNVKNAGD